MREIVDQLLYGDDAGPELERERIAPGRVPTTARIAPRPVVQRSTDAAVDRAAGSSGQGLPGDVRARFERSLGADLSRVRVHTGGDSQAAADAVGARAYTVGQDIHFAAGTYAPQDPFGLHLLAHEVAHTVQQAGGAEQRQHKLTTTTPGDRVEAEADRAADAMVAGATARVSSAPAQIARETPQGQPAAGPKVRPVAEMVELTKFSFDNGAAAGVVSSQSADQDVRISSPPVSLVADVKLKDGLPPEELANMSKIQVGAIQNVMSSERIGVYTKDDGTVAAEAHITAGRLNDASLSNKVPGKRHERATEPFYEPPEELNANTPYATAQMHDQPRIQVPTKMSGGTLTETKGADRFVTAAAAKRGSDLVFLKQEEWTVPWAMKIQGTSGQGQQVGAKETAEQPTVQGGPLPGQASKQWFRFATVADAKAAPMDVLLGSLAVSRTQDPEAFKICAQAVRELDWRFMALISRTIGSTVGNVLSLRDDVVLVAQGTKLFTGETMTMDRGDNTAVMFHFLDVYDVDTYHHQPLAVTVTIGGSAVKAGTMNAPGFPKVAMHTLDGARGQYQLECERR